MMSQNNIDGHHHLPSWLSIAEVSLAPTKIIKSFDENVTMLAIDKVLIFVLYFTLLFSNQLSSTHTYHFTLVLLLRDGEGSKKNLYQKQRFFKNCIYCKAT